MSDSGASSSKKMNPNFTVAVTATAIANAGAREFGWVCYNGTVTPFYVEGNAADLIEQNLLRRFFLILHPAVETGLGNYYCYRLYHVDGEQAAFLSEFTGEDEACRERVNHLDEFGEIYHFLENHYTRIFQQSMVVRGGPEDPTVVPKAPSYCEWCAAHTGSGLSCQCGRAGQVLSNMPALPMPAVSMPAVPMTDSITGDELPPFAENRAKMQIGYLSRKSASEPYSPPCLTEGPVEDFSIEIDAKYLEDPNLPPLPSWSTGLPKPNRPFLGRVHIPTPPRVSCWTNPQFQNLMDNLKAPLPPRPPFTAADTPPNLDRLTFAENFADDRPSSYAPIVVPNMPAHLPPYMPPSMVSTMVPNMLQPNMPPNRLPQMAQIRMPSPSSACFQSKNRTPALRPFTPRFRPTTNYSPYEPFNLHQQFRRHIQQSPNQTIMTPTPVDAGYWSDVSAGCGSHGGAPATAITARGKWIMPRAAPTATITAPTPAPRTVPSAAYRTALLTEPSTAPLTVAPTELPTVLPTAPIAATEIDRTAEMVWVGPARSDFLHYHPIENDFFTFYDDKMKTEQLRKEEEKKEAENIEYDY